MFLRILIITVLLGLAVLIPLNYYYLIGFSVVHLKAGWVFSTFFLRFLVIILFVLSLNLIFDFFKKTRKIKFGYVFLIGMIPGFGISFLSPIYNTDYGDLSDKLVIEDLSELQEMTDGAYHVENQRHIVGFFSVDCGHCKNVSAKIGINQMGTQELEVHAFFAASIEDIKQFQENNYGREFHSYQIADVKKFLDLSGFEMPSIFLIDRDGTTMKHWTGDVVNYTALDYLSQLEP